MNPPTEKQSRIIWFALTGLAIAVVIGLIVATVWGLAHILNLLSPVVWPLAIAAVVACLLSPVVDFFERQGVSRKRAIIMVFVIAFAIVTGVLASIIPQVVVETESLAAQVPEYSQKLQVRIHDLMAHPPEFLRHFLPPPQQPPTEGTPGSTEQPAIASATHWLTGSLPEMGTWVLSRIAKVASGFGLLAGLALIPVYAFYFLLEKRGIEKHWREFLPVQDSYLKDELVFVLDAISNYLVAFFRGQVLVAICNAVMFTIGFMLVGVNYAFLLGFAAVFLTMIPYIGSTIILVTGLTLSFVQYGDWQHPLLVLAVFAVVQTMEGLVVSPKIMGNRVGLHPLVIIIAVMTGTTLLGGILGGILAIPLAAALRVILARYLWKKTEAVPAKGKMKPPRGSTSWNQTSPTWNTRSSS
jgi:predicted PurR-regulated permease PerM